MEKLKLNGLFHAPETQDELFKWIDNLTGPGEKTLAMVVAGMTWNLCAKLTSDEEGEARGTGEISEPH